jgi:SAM-dependent methyltransferase
VCYALCVTTTHRERILDQFSEQALPFSNAPGIKDEQALSLLVSASGAGASDRVLDVACGPGLVVAAFARVARHVTGIDVTPAMLARARELTTGLNNITLDLGEALPLPYRDAEFTRSVSRFAFHHFQDPGGVLREMRRVCQPGGRVVVCDLLASDDPAKAAAFHRVEMLRDPSHARALTLLELTALFVAAGLPAPTATFYKLEFELEGLLARSFPRTVDRATLRAAYLAAIDGDRLALDLHRVGTQVHGSYRVAILVAER